MAKPRYEIDPHNRLVVSQSGRKSLLPRFRKVLEGHFRVDKNNSLSYHIKAPVPQEANIPHQIKLRGKWSLTKKHDLKFTLDKWGRQTFGDKLTLQGHIIDINKNSLLFAVTTRTKEGTQTTYILKLQGSWQADKHNRLTFRMRKERGKYDILTFDGIWKINKRHQIQYQYEKAHLIRKSKKTHTLTFKGHWDIKDKARISYIIDRNTGSVFNFKASLGVFKDRYIKYEVGIGLSHRREPTKKTITLFGKWKIKKNRTLIFEMKYEDNKVRAIAFGADARLTDKDTLIFRLRNDLNEDIGANLKLSHKILKGGGQAYLRALKSKRESAIFAGVSRRW